jgi:hypothetical protein
VANNVLLGNGTSAVQTVAPGTAGNVLTSNGTTWESSAAAGGGPVTRNYLSQATNITLTSSDAPGLIEVTGTNDLTITMPAANSLGASNYFTIKNSSTTYVLVVLDSTGAQLFALQPRAGVFLWAYDTTSAAGLWATREVVQDAVGSPVVINGAASANISTNDTLSAISSTQAVSVYVSARSVYAVVVTNTAGVLSYGPPAYIGFAGATVQPSVAVEMLSPTLGIVSSVLPSNVLYAVAFSVSGDTLSFGELAPFENTVPNNANICATSPTTAVLTYGTTTTVRGCVLTVSGTTITLGVLNSALVTTTGTTFTRGLAALSSSLVVLLSRSTTGIDAVPISISGTGAAATLTVNTAASVNAGVNNANASLSALSPTSLIAFYITGATVAAANVLTVSGTTISVGAQLVVSTATSTSPAVAALSSTSAVCYHARGNTVVSAVLTISGTTVSAGTLTTNTASAPQGVSVCAFQAPNIAAPSASDAFGVYSSGALFNRVLTISGTSVTAGSISTKQGPTLIQENNQTRIRALSTTQIIMVNPEYNGNTTNLSGIYGYLLDTTGTVLSRVLIDATANASAISVCALSSTQAVVIYRNSGQFPAAAVLTVSGGTLTPNTPTVLNGSFTTVSVSITQLSSSTAVAFYTASTSALEACVLTVSGSGAGATISLGTRASNIATGGTYIDLNVVTLSPTTVMAQSFSTGSLLFHPLRISGTTINTSTATGFYTLVSAINTRAAMVALSSTRVLYFSLGNNGAVGQDGNFVGVVNYTGSGLFQSITQRQYGNYTGTAVALVAFSSTKAMIYFNAANTRRMTPITITEDGDILFGETVAFDAGAEMLALCALQGPTVGAPSATSAAVVYASMGSQRSGSLEYCNYYTASPLLK